MHSDASENAASTHATDYISLALLCAAPLSCMALSSCLSRSGYNLSDGGGADHFRSERNNGIIVLRSHCVCPRALKENERHSKADDCNEYEYDDDGDKA